MKAVRPVIASKGVPYLQRTSVGCHSTSERDKERKKERKKERSKQVKDPAKSKRHDSLYIMQYPHFELIVLCIRLVHVTPQKSHHSVWYSPLI